MPFGLTNAPTVCQHMAIDIFRDLLEVCLIIYLDDLLVYSKTKEEHDYHVLLVLKRLREHGLYAKLEKCIFGCNQVEFLSYVISSEGISMDPSKVKTVVEWQTPRSLRDVQCFLGFANFYRKFIQDYSKLVLPLTQLTRKGQSFVWSEEADMAFESLKKAFTSLLFQLMLIRINHSSLKQTRQILPWVALCHNKAMMKSYILWLSTHASLTLPK